MRFSVMGPEPDSMENLCQNPEEFLAWAVQFREKWPLNQNIHDNQAGRMVLEELQMSASERKRCDFCFGRGHTAGSLWRDCPSHAALDKVLTSNQLTFFKSQMVNGPWTQENRLSTDIGKHNLKHSDPRGRFMGNYSPLLAE